MYLSNYDFGRIEQIIDYFDKSMGLRDYNDEAYTELMAVLERVRQQAGPDDGYCAFCSGQQQEWAWEIDAYGEYTGGGFYFCPKCMMVYRPRPGHSGIGCWVATRQRATEPKHDNRGQVLGRTAYLPTEAES